MNMSYFDRLLAMLMMVFGVLGIPMPVAMPPAPDEPMLTRLAPKDAIAFVAWNGAGTADPKSTNLTERLAAEPEVRAMVAQLQTALVGIAEINGDELPKLAIQTLLAAAARPGCMHIADLKRHPKPEVEAAIVVKMGDAVPLAKQLFTRVAEQMGRRSASKPRHEDLVVDGVTFTALGTDTDHPFLGWAEIDGWIALVAGQETPARAVAALRKNDPGIEADPAYANLMASCLVARPSTKAFLSLTRARDAAIAAGMPAEMIDRMAAALGLTGAIAIAAQSGLEGNGFCQRLRLQSPERNGLLGALSGEPLGQDDLSHVPLDAQIALSTRVDAAKLETALANVWSAMTGGGDEALAEYEREFVQEFPKHLGGVRWREDLLANLGTQFTIWNSPGQGGLAFTGATALWSLRDGKAMGEAFGRMMDAIAREVPGKAELREKGQRPRRHGAFLESWQHQGGGKVWWLDVLDDDMPFAPAWTVVGERLAGSLMPQSLRATLDAMPPNPDQSLAKLPAINKRGAATGLLCWNCKDVVALGYPLLLVGLKSASPEWLREGFDFDMADLPRPTSLLPHLGREVLLWEPVEKGYALTRTGTLPAFDPLTAGLLGWLLAISGDL